MENCFIFKLNNKLSTLCIIFFLSIATTLYSQDTNSDNRNSSQYYVLTLQEAIDLAIEDNIDLLVVQNQLEIAVLQINQQFIDLRSTEYSEIALELAVTEIHSTRQSIINSMRAGIIQAYYGCLLALQNVENSQENLDLAHRLEDRAEQMFQAGIVDITSVLAQQVNVLSARSRLVQAENQYESAMLSLKNVLNLPLHARVELTSSIPAGTYTLDYNHAFDLMQERNLQWNTAQLQARSSSLELAARGQTTLSDYQRQMLELNAQSTELERLKTEHDLEIELRNAYFDVIEAEAVLDDANESLSTFQTQLRAVRVMYEQGITDYLSMREMEVQYKDVFLGVLQARMSYQVSYVNFYNLWTVPDPFPELPDLLQNEEAAE